MAIEGIEVGQVEEATSSSSTSTAWLVVFVASLFFFYEFIQMNMFNAINASLMKDFHLNAHQLGTLSSFYFIANVVFLMPAGMILDRFSTRKVVIAALSVCVVGTYAFAMSTSVPIATVCRFLTGIGSAFCFLSCVRLASRWFPANRLALITGLIVTMAMIGGMVAQTPLTLLVEHYGWRHALVIDAGLGLLVLGLFWTFVADYPPNMAHKAAADKEALNALGLAHALKTAFLTLRNWFCGLYTCLLNLPLFILGGLLGSMFLQRAHGLTATSASLVTSMLFMGTIFGSPFMGWLSDRIGLRKPPMIIGAFLSIFVMLGIMYLPVHSVGGLMLLFLLLGFVTSTQVISYPVVAESNTRLLTATCVSVVSLTTIGGGAVFEPVFGKLMDMHWNGVMENGVPVYTSGDFHFAMWLFPIGFAVSFIAALFIKETHCKKPQYVRLPNAPSDSSVAGFFWYWRIGRCRQLW